MIWLCQTISRAALDAERGRLPSKLDISAEAARLLTLSHGLGTSVLVGQRSAEAAMVVLRYHLDQLFR